MQLRNLRFAGETVTSLYMQQVLLKKDASARISSYSFCKSNSSCFVWLDSRQEYLMLTHVCLPSCPALLHATVAVSKTGSMRQPMLLSDCCIMAQGNIRETRWRSPGLECRQGHVMLRSCCIKAYKGGHQDAKQRSEHACRAPL